MYKLTRFFFVFAILITMNTFVNAETLDDVKAQFEAARAKMRDLTAKGAPESELTKQRQALEALREKMRIKQSESFSGLGN